MMGRFVRHVSRKNYHNLYGVSTLSSDSWFNGSKFNTTLNTASFLNNLPVDPNHLDITILNAISLLRASCCEQNVAQE